MAVGLTLTVIIWMLTGVGRGEPQGAAAPDAAPTPAAATPAPRVGVHLSRARTTTRAVVVSGRTEPNRSVVLRAETEGRVVALGAERGSLVQSGERIVGLDMRDRQARLEEARALIAYAELQFEAARKLQTQNFVSETQLAELASRVVGARAALEQIELEVANTNLAAPFAAVLQERSVEIGDYVNAGDEVARLVDTDPLIVVGDVSEREIHFLSLGSVGTALLVNGVAVEGRVRYVAPVAADTTRTFRVELSIPNAAGALRAGVTAEMRLAADEITVHSLSPALLALDDAGTIGVKAVNASNRVEFHPVTIIDSSPEGVSVSGLPTELRVIAVGQGFVQPGEVVEPSLVAPRTDLTEASDTTANGEA